MRRTARTRRARTIAAAGAGALLLTATPAAAIAPSADADPAAGAAAVAADGQVVLHARAERGPADVERATFTTPNGHATVRLHLEGRAAGQVRIDGRAVPGASAALARGSSTALDVSALVERGDAEVELRLVRGEATLSVDHPTLVDGDPAELGVDVDALRAIDEAVAARAGTAGDARYTGATVLVAHRGHVVHAAAFGDAEAFALVDGEVEALDEPRPTQLDTIFDQASITKVAATTAAVMQLVDARELDLDDRLGDHLPAFDADGKGDITVRQLLTHRSGLWEWQPTWMYGQGRDEVLAYLADLELRYGIGEGRRYSDIGFMLLGAIVEEVTGEPLDVHVRERVHAPLGMDDARFTPDETLRGRIAATSHGNPYEYQMVDTGSPYPVGDVDPDDFDGWRSYTLVGEVNDGNAWYGWQGVAGHAGLFATAHDLGVFAQTLVNGGGYGDHTLASSDTVETFLATPYDANQAHGFWPNRLSPAGVSGGYGHGGFTGTEFLFDPDRELVVVLLTNRQHLGQPYTGIAPVWNEVVRQAVAATDGA
jgi:CubicO group peptidase (beta-lactamase class C family)